MKISRVTILTLGVADLGKATEFYEAVLGTPPNKSFDGITFIELPGTWIALYPLQVFQKDKEQSMYLESLSLSFQVHGLLFILLKNLQRIFHQRFLLLAVGLAELHSPTTLEARRRFLKLCGVQSQQMLGSLRNRKILTGAVSVDTLPTLMAITGR